MDLTLANRPDGIAELRRRRLAYQRVVAQAPGFLSQLKDQETRSVAEAIIDRKRMTAVALQIAEAVLSGDDGSASFLASQLRLVETPLAVLGEGLAVKALAAELTTTPKRAYRLLERGLIPGAFKDDPGVAQSHWYIPQDAAVRYRAGERGRGDSDGCE